MSSNLWYRLQIAIPLLLLFTLSSNAQEARWKCDVVRPQMKTMFEVLEITGPKMNALYGVAGISAALKRADIASVALPIVAAGYQASLVAIENNCPDFAGRPTNWQKFADETKDIFEMYQIQARKP